ncbi:helix-turn-helix domain-containing protein [Aestuariicoccus sp. MJ-SS9]|uniref:arsenate reductase/protein-tyrosine-phosphatase family protein n=1 Tax=Aestuariicoccus sp. MJ-SS9 TaxID=3079855 RepID=UPI002910C1F9|nr:helix-turn-helix domain-containing protein [Aestuariicoccus sp. MJ-SS9]MDU8913370.1 helix-turn-helix domain-containing protein [Aestuariicoccus sp. MJ-SS9]
MESILFERLSVLSHPQRMAIFRLLVRRCPDALPAGEIARVLGLKASTASVYLAALTRSGLIRQTRQARSLLYQLDPQAAQDMVSSLMLDCCRGRPDLCAPGAFADPVAAETGGKINVLFLCTANSARSIMAEAILRDLAGDRFNAWSAGLHPAPQPHPDALATLRAHGLDTEGLRSKTLDSFRTAEAPAMDFVFTVCDLAANEDCPAWPGQPISAHWGLPDPARTQGTDMDRRRAFEETFAALRSRIGAFASLPLTTLDRVSLQRRVDDIARQTEPA